MNNEFLLIREKAEGNAVRGKLYIAEPLAPVGAQSSEASRSSSFCEKERMLEEQERGWTFLCSTLENLDYIIPAGTYPLTVTYSPKFKRPLPLICNVPKTSTQQTQHRQLPHIGNCRQGAMLAPLQASVADDCVKIQQQTQPGQVPNPGTCRQGAEWVPLQASVADDCVKIQQQTQHRQLPHIGNCRQGAMLAPLQASVADNCVKYRSGIRIHPGSKPEHSTGCILVKTRSEEEAISSIIGPSKINQIQIIDH